MMKMKGSFGVKVWVFGTTTFAVSRSSCLFLGFSLLETCGVCFEEEYSGTDI